MKIITLFLAVFFSCTNYDSPSGEKKIVLYPRQYNSKIPISILGCTIGRELVTLNNDEKFIYLHQKSIEKDTRVIEGKSYSDYLIYVYCPRYNRNWWVHPAELSLDKEKWVYPHLD